jgi:hypothetical protein
MRMQASYASLAKGPRGCDALSVCLVTQVLGSPQCPIGVREGGAPKLLANSFVHPPSPSSQSVEIVTSGSELERERSFRIPILLAILQTLHRWRFTKSSPASKLLSPAFVLCICSEKLGGEVERPAFGFLDM